MHSMRLHTLFGWDENNRLTCSYSHRVHWKLVGIVRSVKMADWLQQNPHFYWIHPIRALQPSLLAIWSWYWSIAYANVRIYSRKCKGIQRDSMIHTLLAFLAFDRWLSCLCHIQRQKKTFMNGNEMWLVRQTYFSPSPPSCSIEFFVGFGLLTWWCYYINYGTRQIVT